MSRKIVIITVSAVLLLTTCVIGYYFYAKSNNLFPFQIPQNETDQLVADVSKIIKLPQDETPRVATVSDKGKLADQEFFKEAENGDKVLIFEKSKKAYLYRPTEGRIIEVAPVSIGATDNISTQSATPSKPITIAIYNGTNINGLTKKAESTFEKDTQFKVVLRDNAKDSYPTTQIIDLRDSNLKIAQQIVKKIGGEITSLPESEEKPLADILIILGQDYTDK